MQNTQLFSRLDTATIASMARAGCSRREHAPYGEHGTHDASRRARFIQVTSILLVAILAIAGILLFSTALFSSEETGDTKRGPRAVGYSGPSAAEIKAMADGWESLTEADRVWLLQAMADREAAYLSLPDWLTVAIGELEAEARGSSSGYSITVSREAFVDDRLDWELLNTVAHETFHVFQRAVVRGEYVDSRVRPGFYPDDATVDSWRCEFGNYISSGRGYYEQSIESSAQDYANKAVKWLRAEADIEQATPNPAFRELLLCDSQCD